MALSSCGLICKWIVILFNVILVLVGFALFTGGAYLRATAGGMITSHFILMVGLCMGIGILTVIVACCGDYGSSKENKSCLSVYGGLLSFLATASVIGGILAYVKSDEFTAHVMEFYSTIYLQYFNNNGDVIRGFMLKVFHNAFNCCGVGGIMHTLAGATNICPQETFLGINTASSCLTGISIQANSILFMFLGIAGVLILPLVCASFIWQQLSRPVLQSPPYIPLSPSPCSVSAIQFSSTSPPSTSTLFSPLPPYTAVAEHVKAECV